MIFDNEQNKNVALECKEFIKYLGILIDNNLSWRQHIDHITIKISQTIGLISKLQHLVPKHTPINIYLPRVAPYLSYGQARKSYLDKLLKLHKQALRFIYFSDPNQHASPLFSNAGILLLQFSYYEVTANLMYDTRHRNSPRNIQDLFQDISNFTPITPVKVTHSCCSDDRKTTPLSKCRMSQQKVIFPAESQFCAQ